MTRHQFEHLLKSAANIADCDEIIVVGSQAILAVLPNPPAELTASLELDIFPTQRPELADVIDGAIGEGSLFHETFGYYAHGVGPETATLPDQWRRRAVKTSSQYMNGVTAVSPCPLDLAVSKLVAARPKDIAFVKAMLDNKIIDPAELRTLINTELSGKDGREVALTVLAGIRTGST